MLLTGVAVRERLVVANPFQSECISASGRALLSPVKGKFQFRFIAGFLLATGSLAIAALIVRSDSAQYRHTQGDISNGLVTSLAAQDVVRSIDDAEEERDAY